MHETINDDVRDDSRQYSAATWRWWPYSTHTYLSTILTLYNNLTAQRLRSRVWFLCLTICAPLLIYQEEEEEEWQAISAAPIHQLWTQVLELAILNSLVASAPTSLAPIAPSMPSFSFLTSLVLNTILSHALHFFPHSLCCNLFFTSNCDLGVDFWLWIMNIHGSRSIHYIKIVWQF
jgi:hypothetical protein